MTKKISDTYNYWLKGNEKNHSFTDYFIRYSLIICSIIFGITLLVSIFQVETFIFPIFYFGKLSITSFLIGIFAVWIHLKIYTTNKDINRLVWVRRKKKNIKSRKGNVIGILFLFAFLISCFYTYDKQGTLFFVFKQVDGGYQSYSLLDPNTERTIFIFVIALILLGILDLLVQYSKYSYGLLVLMSGIQISLMYFIYTKVFTDSITFEFTRYTIEDFMYIGLFIIFMIIMIQMIITLVIRLINYTLLIHDKKLREI